MAFNDSDFIPEQQNFNDSDFIPEVHNGNAPSSLSSSLQALTAGPAAALKGFGQIGYNINQLGTSAANAVLPKNWQLRQPQSPFNYQTSGDPISSYLYNTEQNYPITTAVGNTIGRIAGTLPLTAVAPEGGAINSIIDNTAGGLLAGVLNDPNHLGQSAGWGALTGGVLGAAGQGANYLKQNITDALNNPVNQAFDKLDIQNAPLGERLQNPALIHASQSGLIRIPFTGAAQNYVDMGNQIENKVADAVNSFKPDMPQSEIPAAIQKGLQQSANEAYQNKNADFANIDKVATANNVSVVPNAYKGTLQNYLQENNKALFNNPEQALDPSLVKKLSIFNQATGGNFKNTSDIVDYMNALTDQDFNTPKDVIQHLNSTYDTNLTSSKDLLNYANQLRPNTFKNASITAGIFNQNAYNASQDGNSIEASMWKDLRAAKIQDMQDAAKNAGVPELSDAYNTAINNYKNEYAPFLDPQVKSFLPGGKNQGNPDLIVQSFLKTGPNNQPTLLNKLMSKLPDDQKTAAGYYFLTRSLPKDGTGAPIINSNTVTKVNDSLQDYMPAIRDSLIPPNVQQTLNAASIANRAVPDALFNPPNGMQMADAYTLGGMGSTFFAGLLSGHPGLMALPFATMAGGRLMQKALTSPAIRQYLTQQGKGNLLPLFSNIINGIRGSQSQ